MASFDIFPKLSENIRTRTNWGGLVSLCGMALIAVLFFAELSSYIHVERSERLYVDRTQKEKMRVNFDISFPHIACSVMSVDVMDVTGNTVRADHR